MTSNWETTLASEILILSCSRIPQYNESLYVLPSLHYATQIRSFVLGYRIIPILATSYEGSPPRPSKRKHMDERLKIGDQLPVARKSKLKRTLIHLQFGFQFAMSANTSPGLIVIPVGDPRLPPQKVDRFSHSPQKAPLQAKLNTQMTASSRRHT